MTVVKAPNLRPDVIGLIPAAGRATRLGPLPCSKELIAIGAHADGRPKAVAHYLLERMRGAGIVRAYVVVREGKCDIPVYFGDGAGVDMHLAYLMMGVPYGVPYTLDQAWPFVCDATIALGFPDIVFEPRDGFVQLLERQARTGADVVLGLFPADRPRQCDMVELDAHNRVCGLVIKAPRTTLYYTWMIAVWTPVFTHFMHDYLARALQSGQARARELFVGDVIQAAIDAGMRVEAQPFDAGWQIDIGTPRDLQRAIRHYLPKAED